MSRSRVALAWSTAFLLPLSLGAQSFNLRDLLMNFVREGITLEPPHVNHFQGFESPENLFLSLAVRQLNEELANQLSSYPLASSAGGFSYRFEPGVGFARATDSFGPVYADRADTIGKGKINFGINYSHFSFDRIDGLSLRGGDVLLVFTHQDVNDDGEFFHPFEEGDLIGAQLLLKINTNIAAFVFSYGVSDRFDVGVSIPAVSVSLDAQMNAVLIRLATGRTDRSIHRFTGGATTAGFRQTGSASGLGDIALRGKFQVVRGSAGGLALAADVRFPSGDERDLLGTGATQARASLIGSLHLGTFNPHINVGYTWSGTPPDDRAPNEKTAPRATIPNEIFYTGGFDWAVSPRLTLAADVLGRSIRDAEVVRVMNHTFQANTNPNPATPPVIMEATLPRLVAVRGNLNPLVGSVGVKLNPFGNFLLTVNALVPINREGLQSRVVPLVGLEYSF